MKRTFITTAALASTFTFNPSMGLQLNAVPKDKEKTSLIAFDDDYHYDDDDFFWSHHYDDDDFWSWSHHYDDDDDLNGLNNVTFDDDYWNYDDDHDVVPSGNVDDDEWLHDWDDDWTYDDDSLSCEDRSTCIIKKWVQKNDVEEINQVANHDLSMKCKDRLYSLGLYTISRTHFFVGGTAVDEVKKDKDSSVLCPSAIAFASIDGIKKFYGVNVDMDGYLSKYPLGQFVLSDILAAEEEATAIDDSKYDLSKNTCVHYAGDIWRSLGVKETEEMADFLVTNLVESVEFIEFAKKKAGGLRAIASYVIGGSASLENYVRSIVTSQLNIEPADPEAKGEDVGPEDEKEMSVIKILLENCPYKMKTLVECYEGSKTAFFACTNCAWEGLVTLGFECDDLEGHVDAAYAACAADCKAECGDETDALKSCAVPLFCDKESVLEIA
eukprot:scaffold139212_cov21-Cyclotella_meneghiniana.AAC.1